MESFHKQHADVLRYQFFVEHDIDSSPEFELFVLGIGFDIKRNNNAGKALAVYYGTRLEPLRHS